MHKLTFHEGSLLDSQTHSCQCECLCTLHICMHKHTPENSLLNTGITRKNRILHRALWKGFSMILQGAASAFDMQMPLVFWAYEKHTAE